MVPALKIFPTKWSRRSKNNDTLLHTLGPMEVVGVAKMAADEGWSATVVTAVETAAETTAGTRWAQVEHSSEKCMVIF